MDDQQQLREPMCVALAELRQRVVTTATPSAPACSGTFEFDGENEEEKLLPRDACNKTMLV